jgi:hypothetical protein
MRGPTCTFRVNLTPVSLQTHGFRWAVPIWGFAMFGGGVLLHLWLSLVGDGDGSDGSSDDKRGGATADVRGYSEVRTEDDEAEGLVAPG